MKNQLAVLILVTLMSGCSEKTLNLGGDESADTLSISCDSYSINKVTPASDSVYLNLEIRSCMNRGTTPGLIFVTDKAGRMVRYNAFTPVTRISMLKGAYTLKALAMGYKNMTIPKRIYKAGDYNISFNLSDEPLVDYVDHK